MRIEDLLAVRGALGVRCGEGAPMLHGSSARQGTTTPNTGLVANHAPLGEKSKRGEQ
jgi:hypothetical protein